MRGVRELILDLTSMAETPLYSTLRWVSEQMHEAASLELLVSVVDGLVHDDELRLWEVESGTGDRTELYEVPAGLLARYEAARHTDAAFDPFGFSVAAHRTSGIVPEWDFDVDLRREVFELRCLDDLVDTGFRKLRSYMPEHEFVEENRSQRDGQVWIVGAARRRA